MHLMRRFHRERTSIGHCALIAGLFAALTGCGNQPKAAQAPPPKVATALAEPGTVAPSELLAGIVAPYQNVAIQSTLTEPTDAIAVQEGDRVTQGQLLARLDVADLRAQLDADLATAASDHASTTHTVYQGSLSIDQGIDTLRSAETAVQSAQQTLKNDQANLQRDQQLVQNGFLAQATLDQQATLVHNDQQSLASAQATLAAAQSNVKANGTLGGGGLQQSTIEQAKAQEKVALAQAQQIRVQIQKATIVSPISGVIVNRNLNLGEYPGTRQIFTIQQIDPIYAVLRGSGQQIALIRSSAPVQIVASDLGGMHLRGSVVGVLSQIVPGSTDFQVKVLLRNPGGRLKPGMAIEGTIGLPPLHGIRIPTTAFTDDTRTTVMTVGDDGTVHTAQVSEVGNDGTTSIVQGLAPGTRVVSNGQAGVGDGQKVAVR